MDRDLSGLGVSTPAQQCLLPAGNGFFSLSLSCPSAHGYGIRSCEVIGRLGHFKLCIYPLTRGYTSKLTIRGSYAKGREGTCPIGIANLILFFFLSIFLNLSFSLFFSESLSSRFISFSFPENLSRFASH